MGVVALDIRELVVGGVYGSIACVAPMTWSFTMDYTLMTLGRCRV